MTSLSLPFTMTDSRFKWLCCKKTGANRKYLEDMLPEDYSYKIEKFELLKDSQIICEAKFNAVFRVSVCSEEAVKKFLEDFQHLTNTEYNQNRRDRSGKIFSLAGSCKCFHKVRKLINKDTGLTKQDKSKGKNTECESNIHFQLDRHASHKSENECTHFNLKISVLYDHNHVVFGGNTAKFHDISQETKESFTKLFQEGYSASGAYAKFKKKIEEEFPADRVQILGDRRKMPDYKWCFNFFSLYKTKLYGKINSPDAFEKALERVEEYNRKHGDTVSAIKQLESGDFIIVVCDPLARRVHEVVKASADIMCVDATSNLDRQDSKYFNFITPTPAGGLPLGFLVVSCETEKVLIEGFTMWRDILPSYAFKGRGKMGPCLIMTDDAATEISALKEVFPESKHILCIWHVLTANYRWLWNARHSIQQKDRRELHNLFRKLLYAKTETEYDEEMQNLLQSDLVAKYPNYLNQLEKQYFDRCEKWAMFVRIRDQLPTHSVNTNNLVEIQFRLMKDGLFGRCKAYNVVELLDIVLNDSEHFQNRLIDIGNGRFSAFGFSQSKYKLKETTLKEHQVIETSPGHFSVDSQTKPDVCYAVNMVTGYCECLAGRQLGPCVHKSAITKYNNCAEFNVIPETDGKMRALYHYIGLGTWQDAAWYRSLKNPNMLEDIEAFINEHRQNHHEVPNDQEEASNILELEESCTLEEENIMEEQNEDDSVIGDQLADACDMIQNMVSANIGDERVRKATRHFVKKILNAKKLETMINLLHGIGNEVAAPKKSGKKRKAAKLIPVQTTAKARRLNPSSGRGISTKGRRVKDLPKSVKVTETGILHSLPRQKAKPIKQKHSLITAVIANRSSAKNHTAQN